MYPFIKSVVSWPNYVLMCNCDNSGIMGGRFWSRPSPGVLGTHWWWHFSGRTRDSCVLAYCGVTYVLTIWVAWRVPYKRQEQLTLREHLSSSQVVGRVCVTHLCRLLGCVVFFVCFCFVLFSVCVGSVSGMSILAYPYGFP